MRSAFITSSGDAYILLYCLKYLSVWRDEVDEVWIALNSTMETDLELLERLKELKVNVVYTNRRLGYGTPFNLLLEVSKDGDVLMLEDDAIIFKKGVVDKYFKLLDQYEFIGSPRMSCTKEIADQHAKEFNLDYSGWGDKGPNFWPNFVWTKKSLLMKTDRNFNPSIWGDTFAWMSVQIRRLVNDKILEIPQYHCSPDDFQNKEQGLGIFDGECGYMHLGSLSSGIESYLHDSDSVPLTDRHIGIKSEFKEFPQRKEIVRRIMWWRECMRQHTMNIDFETMYTDALIRLTDHLNITNEELDEWRDLYMEVINDNNTTLSK